MKHRRRGGLWIGWSVLGALALMMPVLGKSPALAASQKADASQHVVVAYFASWDIYGRGYYPKDIPANEMTHLNYAFAMPTANGDCAPADSWADYQRPYPADQSVDGVADDASDPNQHLFGNFNQLRKLKAEYPGLKILISIGGWTLSTYFSDVAATPESRARFVQSCIDTFINGDLPTGGWPTQSGGPGSAAGIFDGFDIDWEYPGVDAGNGAHHSPADRQNATLLFQEFRRQLDQTGRHYLLTAALPAGNVHSTGSYELPQVSQPLDWINLLTYDFHGPWDPWTNFNSPLQPTLADPTPMDEWPSWNVAGTIDLYLANGVPANKIVVGVPFYARQYIRVPAQNQGLYQPFDNTGLDPNTLQWDLTPTPTYHDLIDVAQIVTPISSHGNDAKGLNGYTRYWSTGAGEPWLYDPAAQRLGQSMGVFISYDDPHSIAERTQLIRGMHLRGAMAWEISQDSDDHELLGALSPLLQ